jgi:hypothetical protein
MSKGVLVQASAKRCQPTGQVKIVGLELREASEPSLQELSSFLAYRLVRVDARGACAVAESNTLGLLKVKHVGDLAPRVGVVDEVDVAAVDGVIVGVELSVLR